MIIKHLENKNQDYKNIKFNGLNVKAVLNGLGGAGSQQLDFTKSTIQVILTRGGQPHVIANYNLKILGLAASVSTLNQTAFANSEDAAQVLVAGQSSVVSFMIPFYGVLDLHDDDNVYIEVQNSQGLFTNPALEASSYLEIKPNKCYGVERFVPRISIKVIQANESAISYMLGDNLIRLVVLNLDKPDFQNNVINNLIFSSDRLDETYTFTDLIAMKINSYGKQCINPALADQALNMQEDQSFIITDTHQEFDGVSIDVQFNSANVAASQNYVVTWNYNTDWESLAKAAAADQKHAQNTHDKITAASVKK